MNDNENPSSVPSPDSSSPIEGILVTGHKGDRDQIDVPSDDSTFVMAELVDESSLKTEEVLPLVNFAARGGAIASVVLGAWAIIGASITGYSFINALLGLMLGFWGLSSDVRWPWLGLILCLLGLFASIFAGFGG